MSAINETLATAYDLAFQKTPIILRGGLFDGVPLATLFPAITGGLNWAFKPIAGADIFKIGLSELPAYDLDTAANSTTKEPLCFEYLVMLPPNIWALQLPIMTAFTMVLNQHRDNGGTFDCLTPMAFYDDSILLSVVSDVLPVETNHLQPAIRLRFIKPLLTTNDIKDSFNKLTQKIINASPAGSPVF